MKIENNIRGVLWGAIIGDTLGSFYKGDRLNEEELDWHIIEFKNPEGFNEWTSLTDQITLLLDCLTTSNNLINCFDLASRLLEWQKNGIIELPPKEKYLGMHLNFTLKQTDYIKNPIKSCKSSYKLMGGESALNEALSRNTICGIFKDWYKNTILHTIITNYDSRCIAASLTHSYIINCIVYKIPINWRHINNLCQKIISQQKFKKNVNMIDFNNHWHIALNYKNIIKNNKEDQFLTFLKKLNIGNYQEEENQSYVLLGMIITMITVIDMQYKVSNGEKITMWYFEQRIQEIISLGGDTTANAAIAGSIIGAYIGFNALPKNWLKMIAYKEWLNIKIDKFIANF